MLKISNLHSSVIISIVLVGCFACGQSLPKTPGTNDASTKRVNIDDPIDLLNDDSGADWFELTEKTLVLSITAETSLVREQYPVFADQHIDKTKTFVSKEDLPKLLQKFFADKDPDKRIVYIRPETNTSYENIVQIMDLLRRSDIDRIGLVAVDRAPHQNAVGFEFRIPAPPGHAPSESNPYKPNPLTLIADLKADGRISLNNEDHGRLSNPKSLQNSLDRIFRDRTENAVFRPGTYEIEKTVFLKAAKSNSYHDVLKFAKTLKAAGSRPVGLQLDELD